MPRASAKKPITRTVPTTTKELIQIYGRTTLTSEINLKLKAAVNKSYHPYLKDLYWSFERPKEARLQKYGDYICYNMFKVCKILKSQDSSFHRTSTRTIAKQIVNNFEKNGMIRGLTQVNIGFLTFKINGEWMLERIAKNLSDGILAWAPLTSMKRAVVASPAHDMDADQHADGVRSRYMRDTLVCMLEYSGVQVSGSICDDEGLSIVKNDFPEEQGTIRKNGESLFELKEKSPYGSSSSNVHEDLAALWCGIYKQMADWIVYVTPVRQRDYINMCFTAAESYRIDDFHPIMRYCGYKTSLDERGKLNSVWDTAFNKQDLLSLVIRDAELGGYSPEAYVECVIKYAYLKTHKYSEVKLDNDNFLKELLEKGNNLKHLLDARKEICSVIDKYSSRDLPKLNKGLVGKEREVGLCLLQFTEVIEEAFLMPHLLCEYLFKLSGNFTSYIREAQPSEALVLLCRTAEAVMDQAFKLLGITPILPGGLISRDLPALDRHMTDQYISCHGSRPNSSSRFEIFSMFLGVTPPLGRRFKTAELLGSIDVGDSCGLLPDGWSRVDKQGCGYVTYFEHDFENSIRIRESCFMTFGNPSSPHAVPFCDSIKMGVYLYATTGKKGKKDTCYELCACDYDIQLGDFWLRPESFRRNTFTAKGMDGSVSINYTLIRNAIDTTWSLKYVPDVPTISAPKFSGLIVGYFGDEDMSYEAVMFKVEECKLEKGHVKLERSTLAVPANETLKIRAYLQDDSRNVLVDCIYTHVAIAGDPIYLLIKGKNFHFELIVTLEGKNCS